MHINTAVDVDIKHIRTFILHDKADELSEDIEDQFMQQNPSVNLVVAKTTEQLAHLINTSKDCVCVLLIVQVETNVRIPTHSTVNSGINSQADSATTYPVNERKNDLNITSILNTLGELVLSSVGKPNPPIQSKNTPFKNQNSDLANFTKTQLALSADDNRNSKTGSNYLYYLTPRQRQVLSLVSIGYSNKKIANQLDLAESTVKVYCRDIFRILDVGNRTEAAVRANALALI